MGRLVLQVLGIIGLALFLFLAWDFSQRVMLTVRLKQLETNVDEELAQVQATHDALTDLKKRAQTDGFIEDKVRREKHYVRDGETLVLIKTTPAASANVTPTPASSTSNWWQDLYNLLFGP